MHSIHFKVNNKHTNNNFSKVIKNVSYLTYTKPKKKLKKFEDITKLNSVHENVPNLDIILLQCIASMAVNNQLLMTQEKCAVNLNSLLLHM